MDIKVQDTNYKVFIHDKGTKLISGLLFSKKFNPDYIFLLDADDWVHKEVVEHLHSQPSYPVWYVDCGYLVNYKSKERKRKHGMVRYCGSTFAYQPSFLMKLGDMKFEINETTSQDQLLSSTSDRFIYDILGNHSIGYHLFPKMGFRPKPFPMRAITWVCETGQNVSRSSGGMNGLPIDRKYCDLFGIPETFISSNDADFIVKIREILGCIRSKITWTQSKITGQNKY